MIRDRMLFLVLFIAHAAAIILIGLYVHDRLIRPYIGDVLVVMVLYFFVRIFMPEKVRLLPLYIFIFAAGVEVLQLFNIVALLGLDKRSFIGIVLGSTFDWKDIICYAVGCGIITVFECVRISRQSKSVKVI